ncbi:restriction endonuclease subunit S [Treponema sp.]|uniref:restriction endonuclease subunit S n=1 Tax=Treponema sp. TaxID=166 RepID=UPI003EFD33CF
MEKKLGEIFKKNTEKNTELKITNVICNSAKNGLIPQREYFDKDIANSENINGYYIIQKYDFVYNPRKSTEAPYGPVSVYKYPDKGIVSPLYLCFRATEKINSDFYEFYFKSSSWHRYIYLSGDNGARHDRVSMRDDVFFAMPVNIPSLPEQKKIAAFFTLLDRRIQKQRQLVESLKTYKRGVIDKFFCNNSYDFELYRLEEIGKFIRGLSYKEDEQTYDNQKTLVLRSNNIRDNGFLNYKEGLQFVTKIPDCEQLLQKNDLVFCMANGSSKLVGKNAVYDGRYNGKITVGTFCCIYRSKFHILQYYFQSSLFQKTLGKIQQGGGGSIGNLKPSDLEPLIVKLPNKYTQEKIFNCLSFFDSYIKLHENKLSSLLSLKSSLLQKMFI